MFYRFPRRPMAASVARLSLVIFCSMRAAMPHRAGAHTLS